MKREIKPTKPCMASKEEYIKEIESVWETGAMTNNGPKLKRLKELLLERTKSHNVDLFVSGHMALVAALMAVPVQFGEVITSPFTFVSTVNAIKQANAVPVFCDIDDSYNVDINKIENLITNNTKAIAVPHIFGIPCDVYGLERLSNKYGIPIIYDGAQAFGTKIDGKDIACFGNATMFSFHAIKVFNSIEGGMLAYRDSDWEEFFAQCKNFGIVYNSNGSQDVQICGWNGKMDEFRAAMGIVNLSVIDDEIRKRKEIACWYRQELESIPGIWVYPYDEYQNIDFNYAYFPIRVLEEFGMSRDSLWEKLKEEGIGTRKLYDSLITDFSYYQNSCTYSLKKADEIKNVALDLPIYGTLDREDISYVCDTIKHIGQR